MNDGYMGKIVRINLTNKKISYINTEDYKYWGGGHGMGSATFFDIAVADNVVTIMTSPFTGTMVPGASGRTEVQGIGVQSYPVGWFTRSSFGERFGTMLKFAGYDGIVIEGVSKIPVWIDIRDENLWIRDCSSLNLWGADTRNCQETIWDYVAGDVEYGTWFSPDGVSVQTTQRPAVLAIEQAGEKKSRMGCLIHDASNASEQVGFGVVWAFKRLKAISVVGTGGIQGRARSKQAADLLRGRTEDILGIDPKLLRAAAKLEDERISEVGTSGRGAVEREDVSKEESQDKDDWRERIAASSSDSVVSFLSLPVVDKSAEVKGFLKNRQRGSEPIPKPSTVPPQARRKPTKRPPALTPKPFKPPRVPPPPPKVR